MFIQRILNFVSYSLWFHSSWFPVFTFNPVTYAAFIRFYTTWAMYHCINASTRTLTIVTVHHLKLSECIFNILSFLSTIISPVVIQSGRLSLYLNRWPSFLLRLSITIFLSIFSSPFFFIFSASQLYFLWLSRIHFFFGAICILMAFFMDVIVSALFNGMRSFLFLFTVSKLGMSCGPLQFIIFFFLWSVLSCELCVVRS